jgi:alanine-synthesizing transaminase
MINKAEVALSPGKAFGDNGDGCVRIALVENDQRLRQAMANLERCLNPRTAKLKREKATIS